MPNAGPDSPRSGGGDWVRSRRDRSRQPDGAHRRGGIGERRGAERVDLVVTQGSNRAIIDWSSFSIGSRELTKFIQPSAASAILNRVTGSDPSALLGRLQSNGSVYLINPNGIVVGPGAHIDAGGFVASTLDATNADFLAGGDLRLSGSSTAAVANLGAIDASQGNVYLVAQQVANKGSITAPNGTAGLAGGTDVTLTQNGVDHVRIAAGATGTAGSGAQVLNSGTIQAAQAELKAEGGNLYALAINTTGIVRATGTRSVGGRLFLTADGPVAVSGPSMRTAPPRAARWSSAGRGFRLGRGRRSRPTERPGARFSSVATAPEARRRPWTSRRSRWPMLDRRASPRAPSWRPTARPATGGGGRLVRPRDRFCGTNVLAAPIRSD